MRKIKIIAFELQMSRGGIETFLINLYQNIDKDRFQLDFVVSASDIKKIPYRKELKDANIYTISNIKNLIKYTKSINQIFDKGYDIAYFNKNSLANSLPILLAKRNKNISKVIVHSHNTNPSHANKVLILLHNINKRKISKIADKKLACSTEAGNWLFTDDCVQNINNGIDTKKYIFSIKERNYIRNKYNIPLNAKVIGYVGRFSNQKNLNLLLEVFSEYKKMAPSAYLLLVGNGPKFDELEKKSKELHLNNSIIFAGRQTNVEKYLFAMDYFVMTSFYEGLPISCVEAQAAGLKVIISNRITKEVQILPDVKTFSINENPKQIAKIIDNINIPTTSERITDNKIVYKTYDISKTTTNMEKIFSSIVKEDS